MIRVLNIIKEGNRIKYYDCVSDDGNRLQLSKDALLQFIRNKQCVNATMQVYNGKTIIRVKESAKDNISQSTQVQCNNKDTILSYITEAKNKGFHSIKLDGIEVETTTLHIRKIVSKIQYSLLTREIVEQINKSKALKFQSNQNLEAIDYKAQLLGYITTKISNDFLLLENNTDLILVSDKQIQLDDTHSDKGVFQNTDFTSIDFHNTDTSNVTNMERMFFRCQAQTLDLFSFNTSNVTNMKHMFWNCQAKNLDLSSFDTSNVTKMGNMFFGCKANIKTTDAKIIKELQNR